MGQFYSLNLSQSIATLEMAKLSHLTTSLLEREKNYKNDFEKIIFGISFLFMLSNHPQIYVVQKEVR